MNYIVYCVMICVKKKVSDRQWGELESEWVATLIREHREAGERTRGKRQSRRTCRYPRAAEMLWRNCDLDVVGQQEARVAGAH